MEPFQYVVVLTSLILALGIVEKLTNAADIVSNLKKITVSVNNSLFGLFICMTIIQE